MKKIRTIMNIAKQHAKAVQWENKWLYNCYGKFFPLLTILAVAVMLGGCTNELKRRAERDVQQNGVTVIIIDRCEYIVCPVYAGNVVYSHKGNCNNPIHSK